MRYKRVELSPQGKPQYEIALGVRDIELLLGEAKNAARYIPRDSFNAEDHQRLEGIVKGLKKALEAAHTFQDTGKEVPMEDRHKFRSEYLKNINRFEIIDHRPCKDCGGQGHYNDQLCSTCQGMTSKGREVIFWDNDTEISSSVQDDGRTLKVFIKERGE